MAVQNICELLSFTSTILFPQPEQFKYPVLISYGAIAVSAICYAGFVRKERGHLLHMAACLGGGQFRLALLAVMRNKGRLGQDRYEGLPA
jgi:iron-regulated transporter 1